MFYVAVKERQRVPLEGRVGFQDFFHFGATVELPLVACLPSRREARGSVLFTIAALGKWRQETVWSALTSTTQRV